MIKGPDTQKHWKLEIEAEIIEKPKSLLHPEPGDIYGVVQNMDTGVRSATLNGWPVSLEAARAVMDAQRETPNLSAADACRIAGLPPKAAYGYR